ncbi:hypothetical protein AGLY_012150 [Aphis glycines]|uniref:Uncharacterized protein n=1 Tax=Aphis glycines TaxID=307491 RepID=A0A6G0T9W3_APHGL|nr:hypothetical protein AGLY_012150 [Aphis glycines]
MSCRVKIIVGINGASCEVSKDKTPQLTNTPKIPRFRDFNLVAIDKSYDPVDSRPPVWRLTKSKRLISKKQNKYYNETALRTVAKAVKDLYGMGHQNIHVKLLNSYLQKNTIFNLKLNNHLNNNIQLQRFINEPSNITFPQQSHHNKILSVIKQYNFYSQYISKQHTIINTIISKDSNLKKQSKKNINLYRKKLKNALLSSKMKEMVDFEFNNQITAEPSTITLLEWNVQKFNVLNTFKCFNIIPEQLFEKFKALSEDFIFIKNKPKAIHNILKYSKISDHGGIAYYNKEKQNPVFEKLIHEALFSLIMCAKFNIVYKYFQNFDNLNDGLTEDGYYFFKITLFYPFLNIVKNLENVQGNLIFDIDMVVKDVPQLNVIYITSDNSIQKYIIEDIPAGHSTTEIFILAVFEWVKRNLQIDNLTVSYWHLL